MRKALTGLVIGLALGAVVCVGAQTQGDGFFVRLRLNGNILTATSGTATVTVPNSTDTLVGKATADTLTNKTLNAESTGNVLTLPVTLWQPTGTCSASGGPSDPYITFWHYYSTNAPTPTCVDGTNVLAHVLEYPD